MERSALFLLTVWGGPRGGDVRACSGTKGQVGRPERVGHRGLADCNPVRSPARPQHRLRVSELVTNAVQASVDHDGRPRYTPDTGLACIHLRFSTDGVAALVEVWDENFQLPAPTQASLDDESGRGLMLVDALAERWGWDMPSSGKGKIVWALVGR